VRGGRLLSWPRPVREDLKPRAPLRLPRLFLLHRCPVLRAGGRVSPIRRVPIRDFKSTMLKAALNCFHGAGTFSERMRNLASEDNDGTCVLCPINRSSSCAEIRYNGRLNETYFSQR
jgi:hypothetical protein